MQQMRSGVIAHGGYAHVGIDDGIDAVPYEDRLLRNDLVCAHALDRVIAADHLRDHRIMVIAIEPAAIADLSAGLGVEGCVVENHFAFFSGLELLCALSVLQESEYLSAIGARAVVAFEVRGGKLLIFRVGGLLGGAFPGGAGALALLLHRPLEADLIEENALIACRVLHEVERHPEGVVEFESLLAGVHRLRAWSHEAPTFPTNFGTK